jgi:hypothetical protein
MRRARQIQVVTKRASRVLRAEQPTPLQDRHNLVNKIIESSGKPGGHQVEPVGRACRKPFLQAIGDEFWRSAQQSMSHGSSGEVAEFA